MKFIYLDKFYKSFHQLRIFLYFLLVEALLNNVKLSGHIEMVSVTVFKMLHQP